MISFFSDSSTTDTIATLNNCSASVEDGCTVPTVDTATLDSCVTSFTAVETKNADGDVVLDGGLIVDKDFVFEYPNNYGDTVYFQSYPAAITNRQYEYDLNEQKTQIYLLKKEYLGDFVSEYVDYANDVDPATLKSEIDISNYLR